MKKYLMASVLLAAASGAVAECPSSLPETAPAIPQGLSASEMMMVQSGEAVRDYVRTVEAYLECRSSLHALHHNHLVSQAEAVAGAYNAELTSYLRRQEMLATSK